MSPEGDKRPRYPTRQIEVLFRTSGTGMSLAAADRAELKRFARTLGEKIADAGFFTCLITNDGELQLLNRSFLGRDYPTDVLSFPAGECGGTLGEIAISLERAQAQAAAFGHSCVDEIRILMLHGFLHLTGLDHERDRGEMARLERKWRTVFGLPSTLIGRSRQGQGALA